MFLSILNQSWYFLRKSSKFQINCDYILPCCFPFIFGVLAKVWTIHGRYHRHLISTFQRYLKDYMEIIPFLINMLEPTQTITISWFFFAYPAPWTVPSINQALIYFGGGINRFCADAIFVLYIAGDTNHQGLSIFMFHCNDTACMQTSPKMYFVFNARCYTWKTKCYTKIHVNIKIIISRYRSSFTCKTRILMLEKFKIKILFVKQRLFSFSSSSSPRNS